MDKNTFGSSEEFKSLVAITNLMELLGVKEKNKVGGFLTKFSEIVKSVDIITNYSHKSYVLELIKIDYTNRLDGFDRIGKYDSILISHLKCYVHGKVKSTLRKHLANNVKQ